MKQDQSTISAPELLRQTRCALLMIDTENRFFWENEMVIPCRQLPSFPISSVYSMPPVKAGF